MEGALQVHEDRPAAAWSPDQVMDQVHAIQSLMGRWMQDGQHFGVIPGCGSKPALLKPGAEKLCLMFRLAPKFEVTKVDLGNGHREITVNCSLYHINTGAFWGAGVGSCSTMEAKYRYRGNEAVSTGVPVPKAYWDLKRTDFKAAQELLGGPAYMAKKLDEGWIICEKGQKSENPDIADTYNTVLKMAKKRALVDAALTATAASDIFTQDIEENAPEAKPEAVKERVNPAWKAAEEGFAQAHEEGEVFGKRAADNLYTSRFAMPMKKETKTGKNAGQSYWVTLDGEGAKLYIFSETVANLITEKADKEITVEIEKTEKGTRIIGVI